MIYITSVNDFLPLYALYECCSIKRVSIFRAKRREEENKLCNFASLMYKNRSHDTHKNKTTLNGIQLCCYKYEGIIL